MNKMNLLKKALPLALLGASSGAMAQEFTIPLTFDTLPEVTITEVRPMNFGAVLPLTQAAKCEMDTATGTETLTATQVGNVFGTALSVGALGVNSTSCSGNGTVGIYEITSYGGALLSVSVAKGTATEIDFDPKALVVDHDTTVTAEAVVVGTPSDAVAAPTLTANTQAGKNRVIVGGVITNLQALVADGSYTTDFEINVVYK